MLGLFGLRPITADVNVTFALSILTFLLIQGSEIKKFGIIGKVKHMCEPYPFMLPLKMLEEVTLPVSLGFRLFGNILGGLIVVELWLNFMTYLSNYMSAVPFLRAVLVLPLNGFFDIFEPIIQTFIFTLLTMIFLGIGINVSKKDS
jgi:F-type H+-transporting ATPase subunit a